jgi:hypothetical protein
MTDDKKTKARGLTEKQAEDIQKQRDWMADPENQKPKAKAEKRADKLAKLKERGRL